MLAPLWLPSKGANASWNDLSSHSIGLLAGAMIWWPVSEQVMWPFALVHKSYVKDTRPEFLCQEDCLAICTFEEHSSYLHLFFQNVFDIICSVQDLWTNLCIFFFLSQFYCGAGLCPKVHITCDSRFSSGPSYSSSTLTHPLQGHTVHHTPPAMWSKSGPACPHRFRYAPS